MATTLRSRAFLEFVRTSFIRANTALSITTANPSSPSRPAFVRFINTSNMAMNSQAAEAAFSQAKENLNKLSEDPGNETKLKLYALFKQATIGTCNAPKPGMMDFVGKAKWAAWNELGDLSTESAKQRYVDTVNELLAEENQGNVEASEPAGTFKEIKVIQDGGLYKIILNRPTKKNALNITMYEEVIQALGEAGEHNKIRIAAITGSGDYYCSGNDLSNFMNVDPSNMAGMARNGGLLLERFVNSFIDFPKPLIGLVNGPAVGVSVTTLGLCDLVYAADHATFHTPFSDLGQTPEGCSSVTFPRLMGASRASEMLMFNKKITAAEAKECGLVGDVFPHDQFDELAAARLAEMVACPPQTLKLCKNLVRGFDRETLHHVNKMECDQLVERWQSDECVQAIMKFFEKKSKL